MSKNKSFRRIHRREVAQRRRGELELREQIARAILQLPAHVFLVTAKR